MDLDVAYLIPPACCFARNVCMIICPKVVADAIVDFSVQGQVADDSRTKVVELMDQFQLKAEFSDYLDKYKEHEP